MPLWFTSDGLKLGPRAPKKRTSAGWRRANAIRLALPTSPLISNVVRPRSTPASRDAPEYDWSLNTRQTKPEQSNPPCDRTPNGDSAVSLVPPQMYG